MSKLKVSQIRGKLLTMFEPYLDTSDIGETDSEREQKILSRCLAAFGVYLTSGCSEKEAAESVWDGTDDNGIDAAFFDASDKCVIFVQSKWINKGNGEPEAKELSTFVKGVRDAVEQDATNFHPRLQAQFSDIALRIATPGTSVELIVISTGASTLARHGNNLIDNFISELNGDDPDAIARKSIIGLAEVYSGLANDLSQNNVAIEATILEWSYVRISSVVYSIQENTVDEHTQTHSFNIIGSSGNLAAVSNPAVEGSSAGRILSRQPANDL